MPSFPLDLLADFRPVSLTQNLSTRHPWTIAGLGDGGAHLGLLSEAPCPTFMLTHWARDRTQGDGPIPLPAAVKLQTQVIPPVPFLAHTF